MRALPWRFFCVVVLAFIAAAGVFPLAGGHAHAASLAPGHFRISLTDDGVGPALTHNDSDPAHCNFSNNYWQGDPLNGYGGFPNVNAAIVRSNGTTVCNWATWNDHGFTLGRNVDVSLFISASANAVIKYGFFNSQGQRFATFVLDQNPWYGWTTPLKNDNGTIFESNQIAYVQISDNNNSTGTWIGAAGIDFTQV